MSWSFSEQFMEDCIAEAPGVFLNREVKVVARQPKINGFRPDLLLEDDQGFPLIVEIQQRAIDRNHLYRCLEYRDSTSTADRKASVILVCEKLDPRFEPIAKSHAVEVISIAREDFIRLAVKHCSGSLTHHLTSSDAREAEEVTPRRMHGHRIPDLEAKFAEINWSVIRGPFDVLGFINSEFGRLEISHWNIPREYFGHIHMQLNDFLNEGIFHALGKIDRLWAMNEQRKAEKKSTDAKMAVDPVCDRRPPIEIYAFITSKGNLSICWDVDLYRKGTPWVLGPSSDHYGWARPHNELLFLRDVENLKFYRARQF